MSGQAHQAPFALLHVILVIISFRAGGVSSTRTLTITNHCGHTVWPGILSSAGSPALETTGFALEPGQSRSLPAPHGWSGRLWGRTHCSADASGRFACVTGNCGSGRLDCAGHGAKPPATLAEFTFDGHEGLDFYDVSLVDGYNLPMLVEPHAPHGGGGANCLLTGCVMDLNAACPTELRVGDGGAAVACKSACEAFGTTAATGSTGTRTRAGRRHTRSSSRSRARGPTAMPTTTPPPPSPAPAAARRTPSPSARAQQVSNRWEQIRKYERPSVAGEWRRRRGAPCRPLLNPALCSSASPWRRFRMSFNLRSGGRESGRTHGKREEIKSLGAG